MIAAAIQITATDNKKENWEKVARFVGEAVSKKANFIVLPEHWNWLGKSSDKKSVAERLEGPSIQFVQELAKKYSSEEAAKFINGVLGGYIKEIKDKK